MKKTVLMLCAGALLFPADAARSKEQIDFNRDIRPLISNRCFTCHGPDEEKRKANLRLDTREGALVDLGGYAAVKPGDPEASKLLYRIGLEEGHEDLMPPGEKGAKCSEQEFALIKQWIEQGAPYARHWSYEKPLRPDVPKVKNSAWPKNEIDGFILSRLEREGLAPSPEADRYALARRVALDLTGLPPTWDEARAFAGDEGKDAYEAYVDAQLAKPAFGERWARVWLDLSRYADSAGYADDPPRTIWAYRDYVIRSLNENKPFDQFTIEQIAGDLLEAPTEDQLIATAFHRNTLTNNEGGTNDEEFRNVAIVDRVNTTMAVWMGTTIACAQCHTHKYDPLTQEEFFQLFALFNQSEDSDKKDERPFLGILSEKQKQQNVGRAARISELKKTLEMPSDTLNAEQDQWLARLRKEPEWTTLKPVSAKANSMKLEIGENGSITGVGERAEKDTYVVELAVPAQPSSLTALRLEIPAEQTSNFVLSKISATWVPDGTASPKGRFVRVALPGKGKMIHLAEVQVFSGGENIAQKGTAKQSSTDFGGDAMRTIDGNTNGDYESKSVSHTAVEENPWFELDLESEVPVDHIMLWNRTGKNLESRLKGYQISLLNEQREVVWQRMPKDVPKPKSDFSPGGARDMSFHIAVASYEQKGFPASSVLNGKADPKKGWSIAGGVGKPQSLILIRQRPLEIQGGRVVVTLAQKSVHKQHVMTHFSFSSSFDPNVLEWARLPGDLPTPVRRNATGLKPTESKKLAAYFRTIAPSLEDERAELAELEKEHSGIKSHTTVPIMRDLPHEKRRKTYVQIRGNYLSHGAEVTEGTPAVFHPLDAGATTNRLALAKWLVHEDNPLTARVIANRHWEQLFGIGIVETSEEFGSQGELPSHPELLDWLAADLRESGWDMKRFIKQLVMSAAYRQSSKTTPEMQERDPYNRLLARGPRFRISAEMVRDQALAVSGLLTDTRYGPSVKPPQPAMGLKAAFGGATDWKASQGPDKYRRGIYTSWRRSNPYPSMATFDAPNREVCTLRRSRTNTPLQALVTLNDPVYVEAAQALGRNIAAKGGQTVEEKVAFGLQQTLIREPRAPEINRLAELYRRAFEAYSAHPEDAKQMAEEPLEAVPKDSDVADLAAWAVVSNVMLNLDEMFMKR